MRKIFGFFTDRVMFLIAIITIPLIIIGTLYYFVRGIQAKHRTQELYKSLTK